MKSSMNLLLLFMVFAFSSKAEVETKASPRPIHVQTQLKPWDPYSFDDSLRTFRSTYKKMYYTEGKLKKAKDNTPKTMPFYYGEAKKKQPQGRGLMEYSNGDIYIGQWEMGKKNGMGKMVYENGDVYEGNWKDDRRMGEGTLTKEINDLPVYFSGNWDGEVLSKGKATCKDITFEGKFYASLGLDEGLLTDHKTFEVNGTFKRENRAIGNYLTTFIPVDATVDYKFPYLKYNGTIKKGMLHSGKYEMSDTLKYMSGTLTEGAFTGYIAFFYDKNFESLFNYVGTWDNNMPVNGSGYFVLDNTIDPKPKKKPTDLDTYKDYAKGLGQPAEINAKTIVPFNVSQEDNTYHINFREWEETTSFEAKTPAEFNNSLEERAQAIHAAVVERQLAEQKAAEEKARQQRLANANWDNTLDKMESYINNLAQVRRNISRRDPIAFVFTMKAIMVEWSELLEELKDLSYKPATKAQEKRLDRLMKRGEQVIDSFQNILPY